MPEDLKFRKLVTVGSYYTAHDAGIARSLLEAEGIEACVNDDSTVGMLWHYGLALGGIKVQVAEPDYERAIETLEKLEETKFTDEEWSEVDVGEPAHTEKESADPPYEPTDSRVSRLFTLTMFSFLLPPLVFLSLWQFLKITASEEPLSQNDRVKCLFILLVNVFMITLCVGLILKYL